MYYSKKAEALRKQQLKLNRAQQFAEANSAMVRLLIPPTTHRDDLRLMPEHELVTLKPVELTKQALLLMTSGDGVMAVDQCIAVMAALTNLAPTSGHHAFESNVFYIFDPTTVQAKLKRLVSNRKVMPIVSVPRSFQALSSQRGWWAYYKRHVPDDNILKLKSQRRLTEITAHISMPVAFANAMPQFKTSCQDKAELQAASSDNYVRVLADVIMRLLSQVPVTQALPPAAPIGSAINGPSASTAPTVPTTGGIQLAAMINLQPPLPARTAVYGNIQARRRHRYDGYVPPSMLAISAQQNITHWATIVDFVFEPEGDAYMRSSHIMCHQSTFFSLK